MNKIYFIIISLLAMIYIISEVRHKRFSIKESFWWMVASFMMLILAVFPYSIDKIAKIVGVEYAPSLFFVICIIFLVLMIFRNSKRISEQQIKIIELAQELAIIKKAKEDTNEKK